MLVSVGVLGQEEDYYGDDFVCPDEYEGYFPHLTSCDKYWACDEVERGDEVTRVPELRTCGNGLAFIDTDEVSMSCMS